jgi:hypothetical protein
VVDVGVAEDDGPQRLGLEGEGQPISLVAFRATLNQAAIQ